jgi:hypothetical protein
MWRLGNRALGILPAVALIQPIPEGTEGGGRSILAYVFAGFLVLAGLYLLIRLLEWDRLNKETPGQDEEDDG